MPIKLHTGEHVYDESNYKELLSVSGFATGLKPRSEHPLCSAYGSIPGTMLFEDVVPAKIPRSEWADRVSEMDSKQMWATDVITWKPRNQASTNFCWANGPCTAAEIASVRQGLKYVEQSAASVTCMVNGYVNQGGWGLEAVKYMASDGACSVDLWPNTGISRSYDTTASRADRANHRVLEWIDVPADFDSLATMLLLGFACAVGYSWWSHEVCATRIVKTGSSSWGVEIRNSWNGWGNANRHGVDGFSVLSESKGTPDDCQAVRQVVTYNESPASGVSG